MDFISFLGSKVKPEDLAGKAKLVIIGCGDPSMIKGYRNLLSTPYPVYADPNKETCESSTLLEEDGRKLTFCSLLQTPLWAVSVAEPFSRA
jgi:hypothetical protein